MKAWISSSLAAVLILGAVPAVSAKPLSRIIAESGLSPDDFTLLTATTDALFDGGTPQVGTEAAWKSTQTDAKGTVTVHEVQGNCVGLLHLIEPPNTDQIREIRTRRCRDANGNWILTP